ncbi:MAG: Glu/Leu/Phe/Val dehydrogenase [Gemmatimonadetes bacterium]|uniref:Glu/Leu/Phe/Val dehydrogenase n=1 Tax=Candidatus Kutchimonas denitrificans TaxID=3056748 RepID=A0AAE4ZD29_9BACT|nr:Glu/Leu/Phe/Val dehydrogenase [Gemmatimonadota bacterium]NIR76586.1 Glu/Leu/Phe/Val dehydrogenase [Candidatus Kutchimonas denitrificans]NIS01142.1 Glu/Leu/Phe/Val dehydrogenase [Gemmatimonadota bacterium]NIT66909.1 Glu/Leu/Phe/Val dehydrogenase [Gemmatimonadota bacterium]NIU54682.1 leucine dehydrogenase [Gemmatimonadota bacterium]
MEVFKEMVKWGHEQVLFTREETVGYLGIIAIHDTTLGPALGGCRLWKYESEEEALVDVLRLSMGMTYKAAVAGLNLGGGKSVIIGDPDMPRREMIFRAHGRAVETLKGRYITAEDVGTSVEDMDYVHMETEHVVGIAGRSGDPSPVTAYGTYRGMKACALEKYKDDSLKGKTVAVQGVGHVGYYLCENLAAEGAKLVVTDISEEKVARCVEDFGAEPVGTDEIYEVDADIFAPCALGAIVNTETIPKLKVDIIAGAANNQLATREDSKAVQEAGILYAPDYVINAGGLINVYSELADWSTDRSKRKAGEIYQTLLEVFELAREQKMTTADAADRIAERRIDTVGKLHRSRSD